MNNQNPDDFLLDVYCVKAIFAGNATPDQQVRFWNWLCDTACGWGSSTQMETDRETSFANGKREVALKFKEMVTFDVSAYKQSLNKSLENSDSKVIMKKPKRQA